MLKQREQSSPSAKIKLPIPSNPKDFFPKDSSDNKISEVSHGSGESFDLK